MNLPPLPEPTWEGFEYELWGQNVRSDMFTADQMRQYAEAAVLQEREECAALVESRAGPLRTGAYDALVSAAAAIRSRT